VVVKRRRAGGQGWGECEGLIEEKKKKKRKVCVPAGRRSLTHSLSRSRSLSLSLSRSHSRSLSLSLSFYLTLSLSLAIWRWWTELGRYWRMRRRIHAYHIRTLY
jgi:hypothetical protein